MWFSDFSWFVLWKMPQETQHKCTRFFFFLRRSMQHFEKCQAPKKKTIEVSERKMPQTGWKNTTPKASCLWGKKHQGLKKTNKKKTTKKLRYCVFYFLHLQLTSLPALLLKNAADKCQKKTNKLGIFQNNSAVFFVAVFLSFFEPKPGMGSNEIMNIKEGLLALNKQNWSGILPKLLCVKPL